MAGARRFRILGFRALRLVLLVAVQIPALLALAYLTGSWLLALAICGALTGPIVPELHAMWDPRPRPPLRLAATLAVYAWWTSCLAFALLAPLALALPGWAGISSRAAVALCGAIALAGGLRAIWPRPRLVRRTIAIPGLPRALDGYRVAQLSDVHCGPFTPARRVRRWVARLNAEQPDLAAVTGDLITQGNLFVGAVSRELGGLRARDGVFACLGNHEYFADAEAFVRELERNGLTVLRNRGVTLRRGDAQLHVAGVDDTWSGRSDVKRALAARPAGAPAILLAHDPNLFPEAAERDVELTLSGHTHGGQLGVPGLARRLNLARLITRFPCGLYRAGAAALYVSRGAGTSGPPIRLGAPAELTLLTLRAAPAAAHAAQASPRRARAAG